LEFNLVRHRMLLGQGCEAQATSDRKGSGPPTRSLICLSAPIVPSCRRDRFAVERDALGRARRAGPLGSATGARSRRSRCDSRAPRSRPGSAGSSCSSVQAGLALCPVRL
jgi:hypothetical protein